MRLDEESPPKKAGAFPSESVTACCGSSNDDSTPTPDSLPPLAAFSIEDSTYKGEGNANVVIALPQEHKVIRFRKSLPEEVSPDGGKLRVEREVEFARKVVSCFLGSYAQIPEILRYDTRDIARLSEAIHALRPDKRRHKEITEVYATKLPDYTFLRTKHDASLLRNKATFCVEIKPKQGYRIKSEQKFQKCPYCLTQYYKVKKKAIEARSTYCPFDLFSGSQERMKTALKGLLQSPQNNLKIFKDGTVVYEHESSWSDLECVLADWFRNSAISTKEGHVDKFCDLISAALLYPFARERSKTNAAIAYNYLVPTGDCEPKPCINPDVVAKAKKILYFTGEECSFESDGLPNDSVLERILRMQRLPFVSADYIYNLYLKYSSVLTDEMIYSNLIKSYRLHDHRTSPHKYADTSAENVDSLKETYLRICAKGTSISKRSKLEDNGNRNVNSKSLRSSKSETIENVSVMPQPVSLPTYLEQYSFHNQKSDVTADADNADYNEQQTSCFISIENILALQNYLLFSSARDCSILMAFQELNPSTVPASYENVIHLSAEHKFLCNIGVSDVDSKSFHSIEKHRQRDIDVLNAVISVLEEELALKNQASLETRLS